jgi:hypothetical protein
MVTYMLKNALKSGNNYYSSSPENVLKLLQEKEGYYTACRPQKSFPGNTKVKVTVGPNVTTNSSFLANP